MADLRRKKTAKSSPQQRMIKAVVDHWGGPAQCVRILEKATGVKLSRQHAINWVVRNGIPLKNLLVFAETLGVSPYCLNYDGYSMLIRKKKAWKEVVNECRILQPANRKGLLE